MVEKSAVERFAIDIGQITCDDLPKSVYFRYLYLEQIFVVLLLHEVYNGEVRGRELRCRCWGDL